MIYENNNFNFKEITDLRFVKVCFLYWRMECFRWIVHPYDTHLNWRIFRFGFLSALNYQRITYLSLHSIIYIVSPIYSRYYVLQYDQFERIASGKLDKSHCSNTYTKVRGSYHVRRCIANNSNCGFPSDHGLEHTEEREREREGAFRRNDSQMISYNPVLPLLVHVVLMLNCTAS